MFLSGPYDDALLLGGGLRLTKGLVSGGKHMPEAENHMGMKPLLRLTYSHSKKRQDVAVAHGGFLFFSLPWYLCLRSSV